MRRQLYPAVANVAIIPSPDEEAGEVPKAFMLRRQLVERERAAMAIKRTRITGM